MGLLVVMRFARLEEPFCRDHGIRVAEEYLRRTMVEGWWGFLSFFLNWGAIAIDLRALRRARKLPFPTGAEKITPKANLPDDVIVPLAESDDLRSARTTVLQTVGLSIALGIAVLVTTVLTNDSDASVGRRLTIGTALTLLLYAVVSLLAGSRLAGGFRGPRPDDGSHIRPRLLEGEPGWNAIGVGAAIGAGAGVVAGALVSLLSGKLSSDSDMVAVFSERHVVPILAIVFIAVVAAPVIEEVLFRGLLVEAFRSRGRTSAILAGAVAFSFWHLNPGALRYYVAMGFLLGYVYWRLGLAGSISAHAAFNGTLVLLAFLTLASGPSTITQAGVVLDLPHTWHVVDEGLAPKTDLVVESPTGAAFVVEHVDATQLSAQRFGPPQEALTRLPAGARSPRTLSVAGGPAVRFGVTLKDGTPSDVVVVPKGNGIYVVTLVASGSEDAERRFGEMLDSLQLAVL
jgi:membrane protease YdiL (CAAX protease family)